ncbi:MAG: hypothetical protein AAF570_24725 [Bacteroidota bacterium]
MNIRSLLFVALFFSMWSCSRGLDSEEIRQMESENRVWEAGLATHDQKLAYAADFRQSFYTYLEDTTDKARFIRLQTDSLLQVKIEKSEARYQKLLLPARTLISEAHSIYRDNDSWLRRTSQTLPRRQKALQQWTTRQQTHLNMQARLQQTEPSMTEIKNIYASLLKKTKESLNN